MPVVSHSAPAASSGQIHFIRNPEGNGDAFQIMSKRHSCSFPIVNSSKGFLEPINETRFPYDLDGESVSSASVLVDVTHHAVLPPQWSYPKQTLASVSDRKLPKSVSSSPTIGLRLPKVATGVRQGFG